MNKILIAAGLILSMGCTLTVSVLAESSVPMGPVHTILDNATEVKHNASIYQWVRVNREVDRIVAAEGKLMKSLDAKNAASLKDAVKSLRSARLAHDSDKCVDAASSLVTIMNSIVK